MYRNRCLLIRKLFIMAYLSVQNILFCNLTQNRTLSRYYGCPRYLRESKRLNQNNETRVVTTFTMLYVYGKLFFRSMTSNSKRNLQIWTKTQQIRYYMVVIVTCKKEEYSIKNEAAKRCQKAFPMGAIGYHGTHSFDLILTKHAAFSISQ